MKLITDFSQWYDWIFDGRGEVFHRIAQETVPLSRRGQLWKIHERGWDTPLMLRADEVPDASHFPLVLYTDPHAHCGEGKVLLKDRSEWRKEYFGWPFVKFLGTPGHSWRRLQIGRTVLWLEYVSTDDWRSNCGDTTCTLIGKEKADADKEYPMYAIDFVVCDDLVGIDFNTAPGIPKGAIEASEILSELTRSLPGGSRE